MAAPASPSSDDPETLKALLAEERAENERLRQIILAMQRHRFGRPAESLPEDQLLLGLEEAEQVEAVGFADEESEPAKKEGRRVKRRTNRGALPAHLPRVETVVDIGNLACPCCSGALHRIGEDVSKRLDVVPAQFRVLVIRRPRYACRACGDAVVQAPAPARLIDGALPTDALVAQVLVSKYADHLPLYRQAQIFARQGVSLDRSTLADWVGRAAFLLRPVHERPVALLCPPRDQLEGATYAAEQERVDVRAAREAWFKAQPELDPERLVFLDETAAATNMARRYGWAPRGERCRLTAPLGHYKTTTVTAALRTSGLCATALLDGPTNGRRFRSYVTETLIPVLHPGDIVVMDNLPAHKVAGVREAIEAAGARLLYLPSYSPDFNPIEQAFAKLKALLRSAAARTIPDLWVAIRQAFTRFTPQECRKYLAAAGYENDLTVAT